MYVQLYEWKISYLLYAKGLFYTGIFSGYFLSILMVKNCKNKHFIFWIRSFKSKLAPEPFLLKNWTLMRIRTKSEAETLR